MSRGWIGAAALAVSGLLAGCSGAGSVPSAHTPTPTVTPTTAATTPSGEQVQALALRGLRASYRATYVARQASTPHRAFWQVARTPTALRIDVVTGGRIATLIVGPKGAFSCARAGGRRACFRVAKPGKPVPPPFNSAPQSLFSADLTSLAQHAGAYSISAVPASEGGGRGQVSCFRIRAKATAPQPRVPAGVYCFADAGVLTAIRFSTGSTVRLLTVRMARPGPTTFQPYSSPTPLPG